MISIIDFEVRKEYTHHLMYILNLTRNNFIKTKIQVMILLVFFLSKYFPPLCCHLSKKNPFYMVGNYMLKLVRHDFEYFIEHSSVCQNTFFSKDKQERGNLKRQCDLVVNGIYSSIFTRLLFTKTSL